MEESDGVMEVLGGESVESKGESKISLSGVFGYRRCSAWVSKPDQHRILQPVRLKRLTRSESLEVSFDESSGRKSWFASLFGIS